MNLQSVGKDYPVKTARLNQLEREKQQLTLHLEETQSVIRNLKHSSRETQMRLRQLNGEIAVECIKRPVLRLVHDRDRQVNSASV